MRNRRSLLFGAGVWWTSLAVVFCIAAAMARAQNSLDDIPDRFLTNRDVIEMLGSGLTPLAVISRIHDSPCKFDKSATGLEALRAAKVPYNVVLAMMKAPEIPAPTNGRIPVMVPDSTPIKIALSEDLDSDVQKTGYVIYFHVLEEVRIRGLRVIAEGARVRGRLLDSKERTRTGQIARLEWNIMDVETVDGQRLPLRGGGEVSGDELNREKTVTVGKGEEFIAFTHGVRKVNILSPLMPTPKKPEASQSQNPE